MQRSDITNEQIERMIEVHRTFATWDTGGPAFLRNAAATALALGELLERRKDDQLTLDCPAPVRPFYPPSERMSKFSELERSLAYETACNTLDGQTNHIEAGDDGGEWSDISSIDGPLAEIIRDRVSYLEQRGLLDHHPSNRNLVRPRDEDEPLPFVAEPDLQMPLAL